MMQTDWPNERADVLARPCPDGDIVREELTRVLQSAHFKATPRRKKLFKYLVEELLAGRGRELKGYSIATLVFERADDFDPQTDPVVRLEARRLRKDLDSYYAFVGRDNNVRISIPKGQYAPLIEWTSPVEHSSEFETRNVIVEPDAGVAPKEQRWSIGAKGALVIGGTLFALSMAIFATMFAFGRDDQIAPLNGTSIAVLPFQNRDISGKTDTPLQTISEEVMGSINRFGVFRLYLSRTEPSEKREDPIEAGRRLGVKYVVDGTSDVDEAAQALQVNARLIDVDSQRIVWTSDYSRSFATSSIRLVQRQIAGAIATEIAQPYGIIRSDETDRVTRTPPSIETGFDCVLRAYAYRRTFDPAERHVATGCLEHALDSEPSYAEGWAMLAWLYADEGRFNYSTNTTLEETYRRGTETAYHALSIDPRNISALKVLASIAHYKGNYVESERIQRQALQLNPDDPDTLVQLGWRLAIRGKLDQGVPLIKLAIKRTVDPPGWYFNLIAIDAYLRGDYPEMLTAARRSTADRTAISWSFVAMAEGALGHPAEARAALLQMKRASPAMWNDPASVFRRHQATDEIVDAMVKGLRDAGWGEGSKIADSH